MKPDNKNFPMLTDEQYADMIARYNRAMGIALLVCLSLGVLFLWRMVFL